MLRARAGKSAADGDAFDAESHAASAAMADALANSDRLKDAHFGRLYHVDIPEDDEYLVVG
jgi:hypothetical protein